jgi:hypothetical protein
MIKVVLLTVDGDKPYEKASILEEHERNQLPNFFEDSDFAFQTHEGTFVLPYYSVSLVQLTNYPVRVQGGYKIKRLSINSNVTYQDVVLIPPELYTKYNIPTIFPESDQFTFVSKEGVWISSDYQVALVQLR